MMGQVFYCSTTAAGKHVMNLLDLADRGHYIPNEAANIWSNSWSKFSQFEFGLFKTTLQF
jgi:hypothetical protein